MKETKKVKDTRKVLTVKFVLVCVASCGRAAKLVTLEADFNRVNL